MWLPPSTASSSLAYPSRFSLADPSVSNGTDCYGHACDPTCNICNHALHTCEQRSCFSITIPASCHCPELSAETLIAAGAVLLFLLLILLTMAVWHWGRCGDPPTALSDAAEGLLPAQAGGAAHETAAQFLARNSRCGRTSIDSCVSCIVCMDGVIDCVLMPCAHEVACFRCASRLGLCPVCRRAVDSALRIFPAEAAERERALQQPIAALDGAPPTTPASQAVTEEGTPSTVPTTMASSATPQEGEGGEEAATVEGGAEDAEDGAPEKPTKSSSQLPAMLCLRCAAAPPNCVFLPCSHKVWCVDCAAQLPPECPICHSGISQSLKTFHKRL